MSGRIFLLSDQPVFVFFKKNINSTLGRKAERYGDRGRKRKRGVVSTHQDIKQIKKSAISVLNHVM